MTNKADRIEHLFLKAEALPEGEREAFLQHNCSDDPAMMEELRSLLSVDTGSVSFLEQFAGEAYGVVKDYRAETLAPGEKLGPYRIVRELGRGGMGEVYLAERDSEYYAQVAIKVLQRGMDAEDLVSRFRNERQILANLNHPNIATLLEGGSLPNGLPFYVMEYVDGIPLLDYCRTHDLDFQGRLKIFHKVCDAVQHAHQQMVIHRDIKPANILVTGKGEPKLLDFGVAKLLEAGRDEISATKGQPFMTLAYSSPEQVRGERVSVATDIYSLGVVLYELLVGRNPFGDKKRRPIKLAEAVVEEIPLRPSTAAQRILTGSEEGAQVPKLSPIAPKRLRGDMDGIIMMALRKDPTRRYPSVSELMVDLRHSTKGLPTAANKNALLRRYLKFFQRHKVSLGIGTMVASFFLLAFGLVQHTYSSLVEERDRARVVSHLFLDAFRNLSSSDDPSQAKALYLLSQAEGWLADHREMPGLTRAECHHQLGQAYLSLHQINLAQRHLQQALSLYRQHGSKHHPMMLDCMVDLSQTLAAQKRLDEAGKMLAAALPLFENAHGPTHSKTKLVRDLMIQARVGESN